MSTMERLAGSRWLPPVLVCLGVTALAFPAAVLGRVFYLRDIQIFFYPSRLYLRQRLLEGDLPLWAPELQLGSPFLADPQNAVLYPPNLLLVLLPEPACVSQLLWAHLLLAAVGAYVLLRALDTGKAAAAFGAASYALGGYVLSMLWSGGYLLSIAWMPLPERSRRNRIVFPSGEKLGHRPSVRHRRSVVSLLTI